MSTPWDWKPFLTGGATRPDAMSGLNGQFGSSLQSMFAAAPPEIQQHLRLTSAFRSPAVQQQLWNDALKKYGSPEAARKWVAPPGNSKHNHGSAADLKYLDPVAQKWAHENAAQFGLHFPLKVSGVCIPLRSAVLFQLHSGEFSSEVSEGCRNGRLRRRICWSVRGCGGSPEQPTLA